MFRLSQKSDYGLILLSALARQKNTGPVSKGVNGRKGLSLTGGTSRTVLNKDNLVSVSSVAKKNKLSSKFLSQVANELKKAGFIASKEGVSGGYSLAKKANEIKILDVLVALDGGLVKGDCFEDDHECNCGAKDMWMDMKEQMEETIGRKTVADLVV